MPDIQQTSRIVIGVAGGVLGRAAGGREIERERATEAVVVAVEIPGEGVAVLLLGGEARGRRGW